MIRWFNNLNQSLKLNPQVNSPQHPYHASLWSWYITASKRFQRPKSPPLDNILYLHVHLFTYVRIHSVDRFQRSAHQQPQAERQKILNEHSRGLAAWMGGTKPNPVKDHIHDRSWLAQPATARPGWDNNNIDSLLQSCDIRYLCLWQG